MWQLRLFMKQLKENLDESKIETINGNWPPSLYMDENAPVTKIESTKIVYNVNKIKIFNNSSLILTIASYVYILTIIIFLLAIFVFLPIYAISVKHIPIKHYVDFYKYMLKLIWLYFTQDNTQKLGGLIAAIIQSYVIYITAKQCIYRYALEFNISERSFYSPQGYSLSTFEEVEYIQLTKSYNKYVVSLRLKNKALRRKYRLISRLKDKENAITLALMIKAILKLDSEIVYAPDIK